MIFNTLSYGEYFNFPSKVRKMNELWFPESKRAYAKYEYSLNYICNQSQYQAKHMHFSEQVAKNVCVVGIVAE